MKPHGCTSDVHSVGCVAVLRHPLVECVYLLVAHSECTLQHFGMIYSVAVSEPKELRLCTFRDEVCWRKQSLYLHSSHYLWSGATGEHQQASAQ